MLKHKASSHRPWWKREGRPSFYPCVIGSACFVPPYPVEASSNTTQLKPAKYKTSVIPHITPDLLYESLSIYSKQALQSG